MILESNTSANTTMQTNTSNTDILRDINPGVMSFVVFVSITIVLTNVFVVIFLFRIKDEKLRDRVSMILSLGVCDIMVGLGGCFLSVLIIFQLVNVILCTCTIILMEVGVASSLFQTFFICLERFLAVASKTAQNRSFERRKRYAILITSVTSLTIIFSCTHLAYLPVDIKRCSSYNLYGEHYTNVGRFYLFLLYIPPIIGTIVLYTLTGYRIKSSCKNQASDVRKQMNAIRTVGFIILTMLLTTGIGTVFYLIDVLCPTCVISSYSRNGASALWCLNSLLNPIIYTFAIQEFRQAIINLFKRNSQ